MLDVIFKIESWILEGAVVVATLLIAYATYKFARGETERSLRYFLSGLAAILLGFYGWNVLISTFPPITGLPGSSLLYYALIGACFVSAVVYFAVGRFERGVWHLGATILLIIVLLLIPALVNVNAFHLNVGSMTVKVSADPTRIYAGQTTTIKIEIEDYFTPKNGWNVEVYFGDNTSKTIKTNSRVVKIEHRYDKDGCYGVKALVSRIDEPYVKGVGFTVVVVKKPVPVFTWIFSSINDRINALINSVSGFLNYPITMVYTLPIIKPTDRLYTIYQKVTLVALAVFGLYLAFGIVHRIFTKEAVDEAVIESIKEAVYVLAIIYLAPYIYNVSASILNAVSAMLVGNIDVAPLYAGLISAVLLAIISGYFVPFIANIISYVVMAFIVTGAICAVKYWLILALVILSPLFAVSYLHPAFKGAVRFYLGILAGLMLAGPLSAVLLAIFSETLKGSGGLWGKLAYALGSPLLLVVLPVVVGMSMTGTFPVSFIGMSLGRIASSLGIDLAKGSSNVSQTIVRTIRGGERPVSIQSVGFSSGSGRYITVQRLGEGVSISRTEDLGLPENVGDVFKVWDAYVSSKAGDLIGKFHIHGAPVKSIRDRIEKKIADTVLNLTVYRDEFVQYHKQRIAENTRKFVSSLEKGLLYSYHVHSGHIHPRTLAGRYYEHLAELDFTSDLSYLENANAY